MSRSVIGNESLWITILNKVLRDHSRFKEGMEAIYHPSGGVEWKGPPDTPMEQIASDVERTVKENYVLRLRSN